MGSLGDLKSVLVLHTMILLSRYRRRRNWDTNVLSNSPRLSILWTLWASGVNTSPEVYGRDLEQKY